MSEAEQVAWELALAHAKQARKSVENLHRLLVAERVTNTSASAWEPTRHLALAVGALKTTRKSRGSGSRPRPAAPSSSRRRGQWPFVQGGLCNGK